MMRYGRNQPLQIANDMHAVYCGFAEDRGLIYVKVGISVRPVSRAKAIVCGSPLDIKRFVFCHIGDMRMARRFEFYAARELRGHRMRGEWYRFDPSFAPAFRQKIASAYRRAACGRTLRWTEVAYADYHIDSRFDYTG